MSFGNPQILSSTGSSASPTATGPTPNPPASTKTPAGGVPLINGTQTILSAAAPNDGQQHKVTFYISEVVTANLTGGSISLNWTCGGVAASRIVIAANQVGGTYGPTAIGTTVICDPGTTPSVAQASAATAGAANVYSEIDIL